MKDGSTTEKCIKLLWMPSKILHGWITKSVICVIQCIAIGASWSQNVANTFLYHSNFYVRHLSLGCIVIPLPRRIMLMRWGFEYNGCRRPKAENDFAELLPCFFQTSKANHTTINFSHSLLTSKWPLTEATEKMNLAKAGFFIPLTHILFSV